MRLPWTAAHTASAIVSSSQCCVATLTHREVRRGGSRKFRENGPPPLPGCLLMLVPCLQPSVSPLQAFAGYLSYLSMRCLVAGLPNKHHPAAPCLSSSHALPPSPCVAKRRRLAIHQGLYL